MEYLILDIARMLRNSGISVSAQEIADCINLLNLMGTNTLTKDSFCKILNATIIKTEWGTEYIQRLVELFFEPDDETTTTDQRYELSRQVFSTTGEGSGSAGKGIPVDLMIDAVLKGDVALIYALVRGLNLNLSLLEEDRQEALENFKQRSGWFEVGNSVENLYRQGQISATDYDSAQESLEEWNLLLKEEIEDRLVKNMSREYLSQVMKKNNPRHLNFLDAKGFQIDQMSREIEKLGKKLAVKKGRRRKPGIKGTISLNRSIKKAIHTDGILMELVKMHNKPSKPNIWLLCDMSNSVKKFSYFMLMLVYTIQKRFSNIRSFIFVDMLLEVTNYFNEQDWNKSLDTIGTLKGFSLTKCSHYGNILHQFNDLNLTLLNKKTTVLILGDAKNNYNETDGSEILSKIKESAAALYWLNPMKMDLWNHGDCVMEKYIENCTGVYQCSNIEQLERFIADIF